MSGPRHFHAMVTLVDIDEAPFVALVDVTDSEMIIESLGAEIGRWPLTDIEIAHSDHGVLVQVPGSLLVLATEDDSALFDAVISSNSSDAVA